MCDTRPPAYSEAYPRLSITEAWKSQKTGKPVLLWRDHLNHAVGLVVPVWTAPEQLVLNPHIRDSAYFNSTDETVALNIAWEIVGSSTERPYAICFSCGRHHDIVVYSEDSWRCKNCLRLVNRSALLDEVVNISIELEEIEAEIGNGRPFRMSQSLYEKRQRRLRELKVRLGGRARRAADSRFRFWLTGAWERPSLFHGHVSCS